MGSGSLYRCLSNIYGNNYFHYIHLPSLAFSNKLFRWFSTEYNHLLIFIAELFIIYLFDVGDLYAINNSRAKLRNKTIQGFVNIHN